MPASDETYTFIGATDEGDAVFMDIAILPTERDALAHCHDLLAIHDRGSVIELWRGAGLLAKIPRTVAAHELATV